MAKVNKRRRLMIQRPQRRLGDVPELINVIQLALPSKDAARTSILSKSWLHAWSTNPAIRFSPSVNFLTKENQKKYMSLINRTLRRYHRHNLPITSLDLQFCIHKRPSAYKSIMQATYNTRTSLTELHLAIALSTTSFTLPDEIFSSANLHTLSLNRISSGAYSSSLCFSSDPSIHCTNLRALKLVDVHITPYELHKLLSTCKLLQKIHIKLPVEFRIINVNNLPYLDELVIYNLNDSDNILQVDDVPSLRSLYYDNLPRLLFRPVSFKVGTIQSLRELYLDSVSLDDAFSSMINSNFPFLETLSLLINWSGVEILDITSLTLRNLSLRFVLDYQIKVHVYAPNLLLYSHLTTVALPPSLLFSTIPPQKIELALQLDDSIDELFFFNVRETLKLSSKFSVALLSDFGVHLPFDVDVVRTILPPPAASVEELVLMKHFDSDFWGEENSMLFDAVFSVCHPMYVKAKDNINLKLANYLLNQQENKLPEVSYCEIRNPLDGRWVPLTSSSLSLLDTTLRDWTDPLKLTEFKLSWCSP